MSRGNVCLLLLFGSGALSADSTTTMRQALADAQLSQSQGRLIEAERLLRSTVKSVVQSAAPLDLQFSVLTNLASVEIDLDHFDEAGRLYDRALHMLHTTSDVNRVVTAEAHLAELYLEADQTATAEKIVVRALKRTDAEPSLSGRAYALDVLANVQSHHKKFAKAEELEKQSLAILNQLSTPDPASVAIGMLHLASFLNLRNRPAEALSSAIRALDLLTTLPIQQPPMNALAEINIASVYSRLGRATEAQVHAEAGVRIAEQYYGRDHPKTGLMLLAQAAVLRSIGQKASARTVQARGERIMAQKSNPSLAGTVPFNALLSR